MSLLVANSRVLNKRQTSYALDYGGLLSGNLSVLLQCAPLAVSLQQQLMSAYYNRHLHASNQTSSRV